MAHIKKQKIISQSNPDPIHSPKRLPDMKLIEALASPKSQYHNRLSQDSVGTPKRPLKEGVGLGSNSSRREMQSNYSSKEHAKKVNHNSKASMGQSPSKTARGKVGIPLAPASAKRKNEKSFTSRSPEGRNSSEGKGAFNHKSSIFKGPVNQEFFKQNEKFENGIEILISDKVLTSSQGKFNEFSAGRQMNGEGSPPQVQAFNTTDNKGIETRVFNKSDPRAFKAFLNDSSNLFNKSSDVQRVFSAERTPLKNSFEQTIPQRESILTLQDRSAQRSHQETTFSEIKFQSNLDRLKNELKQFQTAHHHSLQSTQKRESVNQSKIKEIIPVLAQSQAAMRNTRKPAGQQSFGHETFGIAPPYEYMPSTSAGEDSKAYQTGIMAIILSELQKIQQSQQQTEAELSELNNFTAQRLENLNQRLQQLESTENHSSINDFKRNLKQHQYDEVYQDVLKTNNIDLLIELLGETGLCLKQLKFDTQLALISSISKLIDAQEYLNVVILCGWSAEITRFISKFHTNMNKELIQSFSKALSVVVQSESCSPQYRNISQRCLNTLNKNISNF